MTASCVVRARVLAQVDQLGDIPGVIAGQRGCQRLDRIRGQITGIDGVRDRGMIVQRFAEAGLFVGGAFGGLAFRRQP